MAHATAAFRFGAPTIERLEIEAPIATDLERRQLLLFEQTIDRGRVHPQVTRNLFQCHHSCHRRPLLGGLLASPKLTSCEQYDNYMLA